LETMQARLSSLYLDVPTGAVNENGPVLERVWPLRKLTVRTVDDPSIALLDAWALVGDVLTFYQERVANEGYLRTALERRSVLELARLVGYELRPGVASSVYLAFTIDKGYDIELPAGTKAQSVPIAPGELPQTFETADKLRARDQWNVLKPRTTQPQVLTGVKETGLLYLKGRATGLKPNDPIQLTEGRSHEFFRVVAALPDPNPLIERTIVRLWPWGKEFASPDFVASMLDFLYEAVDAAPAGAATIRNRFATILADLEGEQSKAKAARKECVALFEDVKGKKLKPAVAAWLNEMKVDLPPDDGAVPADAPSKLPTGRIFDKLAAPPALSPRNSAALRRDIGALLGQNADGVVQVLTELRPQLDDSVYVAFRNIPPSDPVLRVFRVHEAPVFGYNAPSVKFVRQGDDYVAKPDDPVLEEAANELYLDRVYDGVRIGSLVRIENGKVKVESESTVPAPPGPRSEENFPEPKDALILDASVRVRSDYGVTGRVTMLKLSTGWLPPKTAESPLFDRSIRETIVYLPLEELPTVEAPLKESICLGKIELDALYDGLESGRWLIVAGDRDIGGIHVPAAELVMLDGVTQPDISDSPDPKTGPARSLLSLTPDLAYCYVPDSVSIFANVARATHGETRSEVLGSGDASKVLQEFQLRQPPLTYVSAPTNSGADSTLQVRVNDVLWHDADTIAGLGPNDRRYLIRTQDDGKTSVVFGNGARGARLPTGVENVKAVYRSGIGQVGNVAKDQISQLGTKPLGLKAVNNPLQASGGADRDGQNEGRRNAPLAVRALDRLVSVQDYSDFARLFAGVGKAVAARVSDGRRQLVHVTIAGNADIPIDTTSDLYKNLRHALGRYGDPYQPIQVDIREALLLLLSARVRVLPDYLFELIEPKVRNAVLTKFSFENRDFGQDALLSEAIAAIQTVEGVDEVDVDVFGSISSKVETAGQRLSPTPDEIARQIQRLLTRQKANGPAQRVHVFNPVVGTKIRPAEIAYFSPDLPDTLVLSEWTP
jgi:hypothetical protein